MLLPRYSSQDFRPASRSRREGLRGYLGKHWLAVRTVLQMGPIQIIRYICWRWPLLPLFIIWFAALSYRPVHFWLTHKKTHGWSAKPHPTFSHLVVHAHEYWLPDKFMSAIEPYLPDKYGREFMWYYPIPELINAKHPVEFELPRLSTPIRRTRRRLRAEPQAAPAIQNFTPEDKTDIVSTALLSFNVLTMHSPAARVFRDTLRKYQKTRIPPAFEHLVDYNFVMASPTGNNGTAWEELEMEQAEYGDLVILDEMETDESRRMPENGDYGKTYRWLQETIKRGEDGRGRKAIWYFKTDEDAYTIMPNLLNHFLSLDPREPTYTGSTLGISYRPHMYYQGLGYGYSYGVVKSLVEAELEFKHTVGYEDHLTGCWMLSLPSHPKWTNVKPEDVPKRLGVDNYEGFHPPSPEPLTGLRRSDTYGRSVSWFWWWVAKDATTITAHGMKTIEEWITAWQYFENLWLAPTWFGIRAATPYEWVPPDWMWKFAEPGLATSLNVTTHYEKYQTRPYQKGHKRPPDQGPHHLHHPDSPSHKIHPHDD